MDTLMTPGLEFIRTFVTGLAWVATAVATFAVHLTTEEARLFAPEGRERRAHRKLFSGGIALATAGLWLVSFALTSITLLSGGELKPITHGQAGFFYAGCAALFAGVGAAAMSSLPMFMRAKRRASQRFDVAHYRR